MLIKKKNLEKFIYKFINESYDSLKKNNYMKNLLLRIEEAGGQQVGPSADFADLAYQIGETIIIIDPAESEIILIDDGTEDYFYFDDKIDDIMDTIEMLQWDKN